MAAKRRVKSEINVFRIIRDFKGAAKDRGIDLIDLGLGEPEGPALLTARAIAASEILSDKQEIHGYQDDGSPGVPGFARRFVQAHVQRDLEKYGDAIGFVPLPGIKPMLSVAILAAGAIDPEASVITATTTPDYPTPAFWCKVFRTDHHEIVLSREKHFLPDVVGSDDLVFFRTSDAEHKLLMLNYPNNPSGKVATRDFWKMMCQYCEKYNIRLVNDGAYSLLIHSSSYGHCTLADVAVDYPNLSWMEFFSASKEIGNATGWRVAAAVGSKDAIGDFIDVKGQVDSGFVAAMAAGVIYAVENDQEGITDTAATYRVRSSHLVEVLKSGGMKLAVEPEGGFFTFWLVPKKAFGQIIRSPEHFNKLVIDETGMVGVHFNPDYIRYAVCRKDAEKLNEIEAAIKKADVQY